MIIMADMKKLTPSQLADIFSKAPLAIQQDMLLTEIARNTVKLMETMPEFQNTKVEDSEKLLTDYFKLLLRNEKYLINEVAEDVSIKTDTALQHDFIATYKALDVPPISEALCGKNTYIQYLRYSAIGTLSTEEIDGEMYIHFQNRMYTASKLWKADSTEMGDILDELAESGWGLEYTPPYITGEQPIMFSHRQSIWRMVEALCNMDDEYLSKLYKRCLTKFIPTPYEPKLPGSETGYIYIGELPPHGIMVNMETEIPEIGISCCEAEIAANGDYRLLHMNEQLMQSIGKRIYAACNMHGEGYKVPVYRLFGEPIICGAAGEPMVLAASKEQIFGECKEPAQFAEASRIFFMTTPQKRPEK